ncbi:DnaJ-domain-containing protein [Annulohypoxylon truncatum]|uniref:DnaJ-domain-containing protein n=1 Tax=Annulohypoxylon truncatum TaxID=327061 RepID=UPI0020077593|nr:DnaJ-domain-containing protein [Annulohypoxylon truncatum]KAI1204627.1 DnaJ-domain-containing protein [Annulohypoxylon truncatum]
MSSLPPDPYKALGVSKDAQLAEIRSAHRKLVLKCHPDKIQDPQLKEDKQREFQQVQQAYELLSNEAERARYDEKVRLEELRKEVRGMASTTTSSPRNSKRHETKYYDVHHAEPRPSTFGTSPHNVYGHTPPSRSWDENLYGRGFDEKPRSARKTASYEYDRERTERTRKDDDRRRREDDKEWARQQERAREREREERLREREAMKEREREREKEAAKKEKDRRKEDRKEDKKKADKDRRKESDDKHRRHKQPPYTEPFPGEDEEAVFTSASSKPEKKKSSSSKKYEETPAAAPPAPTPTTDRERKNSANLDNAIRYLSRSGAKPPALSRAQTYHADGFAGVRHVAPIAVPTPPPAAAAPFAPPPAANSRDAPLDEDVKRSSGRPRRMSHDTSRPSKEKSHKKSSPSKEAIIVDSPASGARIVPSFTKSHSIPISGQSESHRMPPLSRSSTEAYSRPQPPGIERASTWMPDSDLGRERSRSRPTRMYTDESSEDDRDRERRHRRTRRTQSPEDIPEDVPVQTTRYTVSASRKAIPVQEAFYSEDSPRISKKTSYPMPNSSARRADPRAAYYEHDDLEDEPGYFPAGVKYAQQFNPAEIQFSKLQHSVREEVFT